MESKTETPKIVCYNGTWKSSLYNSWIAYGPVRAEINFEKKIASISLTYKGLYQHGKVKQWEIPFHENKARISNVPSYAFSSTSATFSTLQTIEMKADVFTEEEITGTYNSSDPGDKGTFELKACECVDTPSTFCSLM